MIAKTCTLPDLRTAAMDAADIYPRLTDIMRDVFDDENLVVGPELTADDVEEWDSLTHLRLMLTIQKSFGVKFSAGEIGTLKNVGDLARLIQAKAL
jgi:acyl carrier protein